MQGTGDTTLIEAMTALMERLRAVQRGEVKLTPGEKDQLRLLSLVLEGEMERMNRRSDA